MGEMENRPKELKVLGIEIESLEISGNDVTIYLRNGGVVLASAEKDDQAVDLLIEVFPEGIKSLIVEQQP